MRLDDTQVVAPFSGYVAEKRLEVGASVSSQAAATSNASIAILTLQDIDPVKVQVEVPERDVPRSARQRRAGDQRRLSGPPVLRPGRAGRARPRPAHATMGVEVDIPNPENLLKPGMYARIDLVVEVRQDALLVPLEVLTGAEGGRPSWSCGTARSRRRSWTRTTDGPQVQVVKGLAPDAQIIFQGKELVRDGMAVRPFRPRATPELLSGRGPWLTLLAVRNAIAVPMASLAIVVLGASLSRLSMDLFPNINQPVVTIGTIYTGANVQDIEKTVTYPIEKAVSAVPGVRHVESRAGRASRPSRSGSTTTRT